MELTKAGRQKAEAAFRDDMALEARLLQGLSKDDQDRLSGLLRRIAVSLGREDA